MFLVATSVAAGAQTGVIAAVVRAGSDPVPNARAILDTSREVRTDANGRFELTGVAPGRHRLVVLAIGSRPYDVNLVVAANDTLRFDIALEKIVMLDSVLVEGSTVRQEFARAYEDRKRVGLGKFLDSTEVRRYATVNQAIVLVPGVKFYRYTDSIRFTDNEGLLCRPNLWIDMQNWGILEDDMLKMVRPDDVVAIEIYARAILIPSEFRARGISRGCGALVFWTKRFWPKAKGK